MSVPPASWQPPTVELNTSMGTIVVELYWKHAPNSCRNFAELARRGYYNGVVFHRIIKDFMAQTGDPTGTGRGGQSIYGEKFPDEIDASLKHTGAGILSMANSGPNTNGSQFFITLAPASWLDGKHTIFGRVQSGMRICQRLGLVETDGNDRLVVVNHLRLVVARCLSWLIDDVAIDPLRKSRSSRLACPWRWRGSCVVAWLDPASSLEKSSLYDGRLIR
eukprot:m.44559 g.44559  ORF g.44559 m.44559 type:complete len:220 (-) comp13024_c0_seq4:629-1288(-)